jgi:hypothetical protein
MDRTKGRRKALRLPVQVPVEFWWWSDTDGTHRRGEGRSYDVSDLGAFILGNACPPQGAKVRYKLYLSGYHDTRVLETEGQVVRVEQASGGEGRTGFAVLGEGRQRGTTNAVSQRNSAEPLENA